MGKNDPLSPYRGTGMPRQAPADEDVASSRTEGLHQRMLTGIAAQRLMAGVAEVEEVGKVLQAVVARAEREAHEGMADLLGMPDLSSEEARQTHFNAKVAAQTLTYLNDLIRDGTRAAQTLYDNESQ